MSHIEREQKFLVDFEQFDKVKPSTYKHIRQCYLSTEQDGALEVRFRHAQRRGEPADSVLSTPTYTQTIKRRRPDDAIARDEVEFAVSVDVFEQMWTLSWWRVEKLRYCVDNWTVDVFTSGPLQGVAVAELELSAEHIDVAAFLTVTGQQWPAWFAGVFCRCDDAAEHGSPIDLTHADVNLVAASVKPMSPRLFDVIAALSMSQELRRRAVTKESAYTSAPRNRQGVVDLDKAAQRAKRGAEAQPRPRRFDDGDNPPLRPAGQRFGDPWKHS